ncbi:hypothetical protein CEV32_3864 [Brucella rhizosphaerae]|uniref:Uncharacterized protein n=1 Tax=Brucella rhizosphaerae TaxID=571254 RepID=A0A256FS33_9HYPH|nr:hypothetical protein CEV32_3864 [Brucella rhizosphaerae]
MVGRQFAPSLDFIGRPAAAQAPFVAWVEATDIGAGRVILHYEPYLR